MIKKLKLFINKLQFEKLIRNEILIAALVFIFATIIVALFTGFWENISSIILPNTTWGLYSKSFWENVLVEAHGMLFDVLVIGIIILWLNKKREKKLEIKRYHAEIDDFRFWKSEEAMFKIVGNIKRLNRMKVTKIELHLCTMKNAQLWNVNLNGAVLSGANFQESMLAGASLQNANLITTDLGHADLSGSDLSEAKLNIARLNDAKMIGTILINANLETATLNRTLLMNSNLQGANLTDTNLSGANLIGTRNLSMEQLSKAKTLYNAKLDDDIKKEIEEKYPHLLEKPKE